MFIFLLGTMLLQVPAVQTLCECGNRQIVLNDEEDFQLITSPNYPRPYCSSLECEWKVVAPGDDANIYFGTENMDVRENIDFIEFFEDDMLRAPGDTAALVHRCTGKNVCSYSSTNPVLTIRFRTGVHGTSDNQGFHGIVSGHNRKLRVLMATVIRFAIPITIFFLLASVMLISCVLCQRKMRSQNRRRSTEEPNVEEHKNGLLH